jgi:hypothetical protein
VVGNAEVDIICYLCDVKKVKYEKQFLLEYPTYIHIRSHFQNIYYKTYLPNLLTHQNHDLIFTFFLSYHLNIFSINLNINFISIIFFHKFKQIS